MSFLLNLDTAVRVVGCSIEAGKESNVDALENFD